jgi:hypothetical protein
MVKRLVIAGVVAVPVAAYAQCEVVKLTQPNAPEDGNFGLNVNIDGDVLAIGASQTIGDPTPGAAYVYRKIDGEWVEEQRLEPSDGDPGDGFGVVGLSGDVIVVGAWQDSDLAELSGSAYVYRYNGVEWIEEQKLTPPDPMPGDQFGIIPHVDGDVICVPATESVEGTGVAYVYRYDGASWDLEAELVADDAEPGGAFGYPVVVDGDRIIVGAYLTENAPGELGAAYVFRFDGAGWSQESKLVATPDGPSDTFGLACAIEGDIAAVGALTDSEDGPGAGAVYVYRYDGADWVQEQKLTGSQPDDESYGGDVDINNGMIIVSCPSADIDGIVDAGRAYIYRHDGVRWVEAASFHASDPGEGDWFANAVSMSGDTALIGSRLDDSPGIDDGSAYVFDVFETLGLSGDCNANGLNDLIDIFINATSADCNDNGIPDECDIAMGTSMDVDANGEPDECQVCVADANGDGVLNILDFVAFQAMFLRGCPF